MNREREIDTRDRRPDARQSEVLREIGKFRLIDLNDLARAFYGCDRSKMMEDIDALRAKGSAYLDIKSVIDRKKNNQLEIAVLTARGKHLVAPRHEGQAIFNGQRLFDSFVRSREVFHDAAIYPAAKDAIARIEAQDGSVTRIVLDHELKGMKARLTNVRHPKIRGHQPGSEELERYLAARDRLAGRLKEMKRIPASRFVGPVDGKVRVHRHDPYSSERAEIRKELRSVERLIRDLQFDKANAKLTPAQQRAIAAELKLKVSELSQKNGRTVTKILIPDVRIEYRDRHGNQQHLDLEITTSSYREAGKKAKAAAGFKLVGQAAGGKMRDEDSLWG